MNVNNTCFCTGPQNGEPHCPCKMRQLNSDNSIETEVETLKMTEEYHHYAFVISEGKGMVFLDGEKVEAENLTFDAWSKDNELFEAVKRKIHK